MGGGVSVSLPTSVSINRDAPIVPSSYQDNAREDVNVIEHELLMLGNEDKWEEEENEIDEDHVYSALKKLSFLIEIDEALKKKLVHVICHTYHIDKVAQFDNVQEWIEDNFEVFLNADEVHNLIKYVELYEPGRDDDDNNDDTASSPGVCDCGNVESSDKVENNNGGDYSYLDCPFRCEIAVLAAEIQRQILSKTVPQYSNTERSAFSTPTRMSPYPTPF